MSACNKSDAKQNSKHRAAWQARANAKTWEVKKAKRIATNQRHMDAAARKNERRAKCGKPDRGHARRMRRAGIQ